jgi:3',5'-cyclic AMP phosphodiesterase CpdA
MPDNHIIISGGSVMHNISRRGFLRSSVVLTAGLSLGITGCGGSSDSDNISSAKFAVLSDPHVYDTSLGTTGTAFETYLASDRKMLAQSSEILENVVDNLLAVSGLDFVLVPGDLTKDGEYVCHQKFVSIMQPLIDKGVKVYVVPGNHDINNPHAVSFSGDTTTEVDSITPAGFAAMYDAFGYGDALYRDPNSLSYIADIADNVWLFAIDSCKYDNNIASPDTSGAITDETLDWITGKLAEAKSRGITVFGMQHHAITPHFAAQTTFFAEYVLDDYAAAGETLADAGLNLFFTGHFHAQDIIKATFANSELYEIETGSTVTAPCPYRVIDLDVASGQLTINSYEINEIDSVADFATYKTTFTADGMLDLYTALLPAYGINAAVAPAASEVHVLHYAGDEKYSDLSATADAIIQSLVASADADTAALGYALIDWATDSEPGDNDTTITF